MQTLSLPPFSVLMSVYFRERPEHLEQSIESLMNQILKPDEIVVVKDGELGGGLDSVIDRYQREYPRLFKVISLEKNQGLGTALNHGLHNTSHELVARMDSDDVCMSDRFAKQITYLAQHPEIDVIGSSIAEFEFSASEPYKSVRAVPETHAEITNFIKRRCPVNHQTVIFKKSKVLAAGAYNTNKINYEDFPLWYRMICNGAIFHNLQIPLVSARTGSDLIGRRHGKKYLSSEIKLFSQMRADRYITIWEYIQSVVPRIFFRLMPKSILQQIYRTFLRSTK